MILAGIANLGSFSAALYAFVLWIAFCCQYAVFLFYIYTLFDVCPAFFHFRLPASKLFICLTIFCFKSGFAILYLEFARLNCCWHGFRKKRIAFVIIILWININSQQEYFKMPDIIVIACIYWLLTSTRI